MMTEDAKNETKLRETLDADIRREINECFDNIINKIDIQALECEMSNEDGSDLENNKLMKKTYLEIISVFTCLRIRVQWPRLASRKLRHPDHGSWHPCPGQPEPILEK